MVKIDMDEEKLEAILEQQREFRESDVSGSWIESVTEQDLVEPAKEALTEDRTSGESLWFREPDVRVRPRGASESPGKVSEEPDLVRVIETESSTIYYVIELKTEVNKKAFGQVLHYYWAFQEGDKLVSEDTTHELPENPALFVAIAAPRWKQEYYKQFWNWVREAVELEHGTLEFIPIDESDIDVPLDFD